MARLDGVDPQSVACPTCGRKKGLLCAKKVKGGGWEGFSKRSHSARVVAALVAKMKGGAA